MLDEARHRIGHLYPPVTLNDGTTAVPMLGFGRAPSSHLTFHGRDMCHSEVVGALKEAGQTDHMD